MSDVDQSHLHCHFPNVQGQRPRRASAASAKEPDVLALSSALHAAALGTRHYQRAYGILAAGDLVRTVDSFVRSTWRHLAQSAISWWQERPQKKEKQRSGKLGYILMTGFVLKAQPLTKMGV